MTKRPKQLMYAGGGVLILGIILGQFFGLTPGINTDSGPGESETTTESTTESAAESQAILASSESDIVPILIAPEPKRAKSQLEVPLQVLDILIENRSYLIKSAVQSQDGYRPAEIDEIIRFAKQASGDEDGIRIRVYRKGSARVIPESQLKDALKRAGVPQQSIDWKTHLVD
ncbi:hypothetical protein [uncultured Gimesia sp.]|uniref:hypothetical protein n=1 Tax=uncultured Gimesia sp. TaxID=1678688 RepID=UPI0030DD2E59|tara:strand:- start:31044 stop:31562 length:519 start_codon:yes stop_codon:yes gene_type:complete